MTSDYTNAEYEKDVSEYAESILSETIADHPEADADEMREEVQERLHETVDGCQEVIYTWRAQLVLAHSSNDGYAASEFGAESVLDSCGNLHWSALAYGAMYADVSEELWPLFDAWATIHEFATEILDELDEDHEFSGALTVAIKRLGLMGCDEEQEIRAECNRIFKAKVSA